MLMHEEGRVSQAELDNALAGRALNTTPAIKAPDSAPDDWLGALPADQYLLQLLASSNRQRLEEFASKQLDPAQTPPLLYSTTREGKAWHVLLIGPFETPAQARAAGQSLPAAVRKNETWVRTIKSLQ